MCQCVWCVEQERLARMTLTQRRTTDLRRAVITNQTAPNLRVNEMITEITEAPRSTIISTTSPQHFEYVFDLGGRIVSFQEMQSRVYNSLNGRQQHRVVACTVRCRTCDANRRELCITSRGVMAQVPHVSRVRQARQVWRGEREYHV